MVALPIPAVRVMQSSENTILQAREAAIRSMRPPHQQLDGLTKMPGAHAGRAEELFAEYRAQCYRFHRESGFEGEPKSITIFLEGKNISCLNDAGDGGRESRKLVDRLIISASSVLKLAAGNLPFLLERRGGDELVLHVYSHPNLTDPASDVVQKIRTGLSESLDVILGRKKLSEVSEFTKQLFRELDASEKGYVPPTPDVLETTIKTGIDIAVERSSGRKILGEFAASNVRDPSGAQLREFLLASGQGLRMFPDTNPDDPENLRRTLRESPYRALLRLCREQSAVNDYTPSRYFGFDVAATQVNVSEVTAEKSAKRVARLDHETAKAKATGETVICKIIPVDLLDKTVLSPAEEKAIDDGLKATEEAISTYRSLELSFKGLTDVTDPAVKSQACLNIIKAGAVDSSSSKIIRRDQVNSMSGLALLGDLSADNRGILAFSFPVRAANKDPRIGMSKIDEMIGSVMKNLLDLDRCKNVWPSSVTQQDLDKLIVMRSSGGDIFILGAPILDDQEFKKISSFIDSCSADYWRSFCAESEDNERAVRVASVLTRAEDERRLDKLGVQTLVDLKKEREGLGFTPTTFGQVSVASGTLAENYKELQTYEILGKSVFSRFDLKFRGTMNLPDWIVELEVSAKENGQILEPALAL